jgi:hypothetical protein
MKIARNHLLSQDIARGPPYCHEAAVKLYLSLACCRPQRSAAAWAHRIAYEEAKLRAVSAKAASDPAYLVLTAAAQAAKITFLENVQLEHTCIRDSFLEHWRIVALGDLLAGYSPFPDASLILPVYHAGQVLTRLKDYVTAEKERKAPIPLGLYLPVKGKPNVDYFE